MINWNDIPYAMPPIDDLRWKAPRKIDDSSNLILPKEYTNWLKPNKNFNYNPSYLIFVISFLFINLLV